MDDDPSHIEAVGDEIKDYNRRFARDLTSHMTRNEDVSHNINLIISIVTDKNNKPARTERMHMIAILFLIITLPIACAGPFSDAHFRMVSRVKRLHFVNARGASVRESSWAYERSRALLHSALPDASETTKQNQNAYGGPTTTNLSAKS